MSQSTNSTTFKILFDHSPIPMWEMDFTDLYHYFRKLKNNGTENFAEYLEQNPEQINSLFSQYSIKNVNLAALELYEVSSKEEFISAFNIFFSPHSVAILEQQYIQFFNNQDSFTTNTSITTTKNQTKSIRLKINILKEDNKYIGIVASEDISEFDYKEQEFIEAISNSPDAITINRLSDGIFSFVNQTFTNFSGYTEKEIKNKSAYDLGMWINEDDRAFFFHELNKHGFIQDLSTPFRMKNGRVIDGLLSARKIEYKGEPHLIVTNKDVTQINKLARNLEISEEKFQNIFSKSPDALAILETENWTYIDANEEFISICGYHLDHIIGKTSKELNFWAKEADANFFTKKLTNNDEIINYKSQFINFKGEQIHMLVSAKIIEINSVKHYLLIAKNIDEFEKVQLESFEQANKYKTIVGNSNEGICIINNQYTFDYVNQKMLDISGYSYDELVGHDFRMVLTAESKELVETRYRQRQAGIDIPQKYEFKLLHKSGDIRSIHMYSSVIRSADGSPQTIAQLLDITEREKANTAIKQKHNRALQYFEVAGILMLALDLDGNITALNKKGCEVLGIEDINNFKGENWFTTFIPNRRTDLILNEYSNSLSNKKLLKPFEENLVLTVQGKEKLISWYHNFIRDENNNIVGTISSGEDITDKDEARKILKMSGMVTILWNNKNDIAIEFISENCTDLLGYTPQDFYSGKITFQQLFHPDDRDRVNADEQKFTEEKRTNYTHKPHRIISKNGKIKWLNTRTTVEYDDKGHVIHNYGIISDITDDISRSEKLHQSTEILAQMNDGVIISNFNGVITSWVGGSEHIFGYKSENILGLSIRKIWTNDLSSETKLKEIIERIEQKGFYQGEIKCTHKNGNEIPIELTAKILFDSNNKPLSLILVNRDITNRKIAQNELEASEKRYRNIFESILDGVIIYNMQQEIVQVNKMAIQMYGYTYQEFIQKETSRYIHPVQNHSFETVINHLNNDYDRMFEGESIDLTKSGDRFFVNVKGRIINYNKEPHLLIIIRDITKIKQSEQDLFKAKEKAIESEQLKSAFLANMSHEIRTPMNSIIGFSDLLGDEDISNEEKNHFIRIIRQNGNQLMNIINDIIDISKIEAGQIKLNYEPINLHETLSDIYNMFQLTAADKNLKIIKKTCTAEKSFMIKTDELRLKQILINLISNSIKFTHHGFIEFGCNIIDEGKSIHFYVKDTGIGISKDKQSEIFQRFMQAELKTTKLYGGTGLGLAISQGLVQTFKGKLWLESDESLGSTFNFSFPLILV